MRLKLSVILLWMRFRFVGKHNIGAIYVYIQGHSCKGGADLGQLVEVANSL